MGVGHWGTEGAYGWGVGRNAWGAGTEVRRLRANGKAGAVDILCATRILGVVNQGVGCEWGSRKSEDGERAQQ